MDFELLSLKNTSEEKESLDDKWYDRFKTLASFADYEYLNGEKASREKQKVGFLSGEIENPILDYPELEKIDFEKRETDLLLLKRDILKQETNSTVRQLYIWKLNEKIAELRMLKATKNGNDQRFSRYSRFIYGNPEKNIYEYTISQIKKTVDTKLSDNNPDVRQVAQEINSALFETLMNNENDLSPKDFSMPEKKIDADKLEYSAEEIKQSFILALEKYNLLGWDVIVDTEGKVKAINVSQEKKAITIPETRKLKGLQLKALIEHEIGTHVARREKGEKTKLKLLGLGLDRYLKGEEGIATYQEQKVEGANDFSGFEGHLAISLASGIDGKKRNFREVFDILKNYYFIQSKKTGEETWKSAKDSAWNRCIRTFRGTTCQTPGACLTRDIAYREGNIGIWNIVKNNPEEIKRFSVGKYDPNNSRHIWILEQLNITEEDLTLLENSPEN